MKLVKCQLANGDTITTDDGFPLGMIYYGVMPVDDELTKPADAFREWFKEASEAREDVTTWDKFVTYTEWCRVKGLADPSVEDFEAFIEAGGFKGGDDTNTPSSAG